MNNVITEAALSRMPPGRAVKFEVQQDMSGVAHQCVLWVFVANGVVRRGYFDIFTGEYIGDEI